MIILVCGGRDYDDYSKVDSVLYSLIRNKNNIKIIQGGAKGADYLAWIFALKYGIKCEEYKADWNKYGRASGAIRNQEMLQQGQPNLVVAFPGGKGTADMVKRAKRAGVEVIEIE